MRGLHDLSSWNGGASTSNFYWLNEDQIIQFWLSFSKSHGVPRVDDWGVLSGIIFS